MATTDSRRTDGQTTLGGFGVYKYDRGEFLETSAGKIQLSECPLCAVDPSRPRHPFGGQSKRAKHFRDHHTADEI